MMYDTYDASKPSIDCSRLVNSFLECNYIVRCGKQYYIYFEDIGIFQEISLEDLQIMVARQYETVTGRAYHVRYSRQITELLKVRIELVQQMDWDTNKLCLANCVLDLVTFEVFEHSPEYRFTNRSEVSYNPAAECPKFEEFMTQICMGNDDRKKSLEEFMGLCMTNEIGYGSSMVLFGHGANGKSVYCNLLTDLLGKGFYTTITLKDLCSFGTGKIPNKKLVIITEINKMSSADLMTNELKQIISGEIMDCNIKHVQNTDMKPVCKVAICTNHQIGFLNDDSEGSLRRIFVCPFEYFVPPDERDYHLEDKLRDELSGILNVALVALKRLRANNYQYSAKKESDKIINELLRKENPLRAFVRENLMYCSGHFLTYETITSQYDKWCKKHGVHSDSLEIGLESDAHTKQRTVMSKRIFKEISNYFNIERHMSNGIRGIKNVKFRRIIK